MGRYLMNSKRIGEVTIMELSDAVVDMDVPSMTKKRKICAALLLRSHNGVADTPGNLVSPVTSLVYSKENFASSDEPAGISTSCCSSNSSLDLDENSVEIADKEKKSSFNECQQESGELESKKMLPHDHDDPPPGKIPTTKEIEEFLTRCEKKIFKQFREKYNFNFEKEEPLEGRYKWIRT